MNEYNLYSQLGTLPVAWTSSADEWLSRLGECIPECEEDLQLAGHKYDVTTAPFVQVTFAREGVVQDGHLLVAGVQDDHIIMYVGWNSEPDSDLLEVFACATQKATERMGEEGPEHTWTALIGAPSTRISGTEVFLVNEASVGPFHLSSTGTTLREASFPLLAPSLNQVEYKTSVPILVRASHRGYSWNKASLQAARELNQLCGLLSVAWGTCLVIRESLAPLSWGERRVPDKIFWQEDPREESPLPQTEEAPLPQGGRELPDWADSAWSLIKERPRISDAVTAHNEALRAENEHPSLALVAFIASIEAISQMIYREDRCEECDGHRYIAAKFRSTLRLVLSEEEAAQLGNAYSPRSHTVHRGRLHGTEVTAGAHDIGIWSREETYTFRWETVQKMRQASQKLLEMALKGELPKKGAFTPTSE